MRILSALLLPAMLAACGEGENAPGPGGVTWGEARALDEAAEMIEERRLPASALRPPVAPDDDAKTGAAQTPSP